MITSKFKLIESLFVDYLNKETDSINADCEDIISSVYIYPPDDQQKPRNCCVGIDVLFQNVVGDNSDNLSLELYVEEKQDLRMNVRTAWGYPSGERVGRMFPEAVVVTDENLKLVQEKLPDMIEELRQSIQNNPNGK